MSYGDDIRAARKGLKLSIRAAAELVGIHYVTLHAFETGKQRPGPVNAERIKAELGVSPEPLVDARYEAECKEYGVKPRWKR